MSLDNLDKKTYGELMYRLGRMDAILEDLRATTTRFHIEAQQIREGQSAPLVAAMDEVLQRETSRFLGPRPERGEEE